MRFIDMDLPADYGAVAAARRAVESARRYVSSDRMEDLRLMVSELVSNCLRHGGLESDDRIGLQLEVQGPAVRVEVHNAGNGFDPPNARTTRWPDDRGWGLFIVEQLASAWGVAGGEETCVWFEMPSDARGDGS
jgi:anti-sigma regulatory factor (Ser/Thr protein kinase)